MKFVSTRGKSQPVDFSETFLPMSLSMSSPRIPRLSLASHASDGGLWMPERLPHLDLDEFRRPQALSEFASLLLKTFIDDPFLDTVCKEAFNFATPELELHHGPTGSMYDLGARFFVSYFRHLHSSARLLLAASYENLEWTAALASAFATLAPTAKVDILYSNKSMSIREERQLTSWGSNVRAFRVRGNEATCRSLVEYRLATSAQYQTASSQGPAPILALLCAYAKASLDFNRETGRKPTLVIPTRHLTGGTSALMAKRLGFPIQHVVLATKDVRIVDYFETGIRPAPIGPAFHHDLENLERLEHLYPEHPSLNRYFLRQDACAVLAQPDDALGLQQVENGLISKNQAPAPHGEGQSFELDPDPEIVAAALN